MTNLVQAASRFDKLIATAGYQDQAWASELQSQLAAKGLIVSGRPICPALRPHFLSKRQYEQAVKVSATLYSALGRLEEMALKNPAILARLESLPAEKMLAQVDPGYPGLTAASYLTLRMNESQLTLEAHSAEPPTSVLVTDELAALYWDSRPMKELRKKQKLAKPAPGTKALIQAIFSAYKGYPHRGKNKPTNGVKKFPRIAIVEAGQGLRSAAAPDSQLLAENLRQLGFPTEVVPPELLEYRNGQLCRGDFGIEIVYRRISAQELLVRFNLNHPLLRAYRDGAVKVINGFRADLLSKPSAMALLTDDTIVSQFPAAERKVLAAHVPWTRMIAPGKVTLPDGGQVDLLEYVLQNRETLVLRPNEPVTDAQTYRGFETEPATWDRALRIALRTPYVVQQLGAECRATFPVLQSGRTEMREMRVATQVHLFGGDVKVVTSTLTDATSAFSMMNGPAPVFVL